MENDKRYEDLVREAQQAGMSVRRELLDDLIGQFAGAAYQWALVVLDDEDLAFDALQDAWLNAYLHLDQLRDSGAFPGWFRQIVLSASIRALRRQRDTKPLTEDEPADSEPHRDPVEALEHNEQRENVRDAVLALPDKERVVTELFYFEEYAQQEIAEALAVPLTTVKKRLQYARRHLKDLLPQDVLASLQDIALNGGSVSDLEQAAPWFFERQYEWQHPFRQIPRELAQSTAEPALPMAW